MILALVPSCLALGDDASSAPVPPGDHPIRALSKLEGIIPVSLRSLLLDKPAVKFLVVIGPDGRLLDYLAIEATHYKLLPAAIEQLGATRFEPAVAGGRAVQATTALYLTFYDPEQRAYFKGGAPLPFGGSVSDAVERRLYEGSKEHFIYHCSQPAELDKPIAVTQGKLMVMTDAAGRPAQGSAVVEFYIDQDGTPRLPRIVRADNDTVAVSALLTVKETRYAPPTTHEGIPTCVKVRQPVNYTGALAAAEGTAG